MTHELCYAEYLSAFVLCKLLNFSIPTRETKACRSHEANSQNSLVELRAKVKEITSVHAAIVASVGNAREDARRVNCWFNDEGFAQEYPYR